jgi:hypothetical protein
MTSDEAVKLVSQWPKDRTVPKQLRVAYDKAKGEDKWKIGTLTEALMAASESEADTALVAKYFG